MKTNRVYNEKQFSELLQETFLLRMLGLNNKEVSIRTGKKESAVEGHIERVNDFYSTPGSNKRSIELSIGRAMKWGDGQKLLDKFRPKYPTEIAEFEKQHAIAFEKL